MEDRRDLEVIRQQLNTIAEQLARLTEAAERQRAWDELAAELAPSLRAAHDTAREQLAEVQPHVNRDELWHLFRHLACSAGDISAVLEQLESLRDLLADAAPLTVEASETLIERLDDLERRGYFAIARELGAVLDRFVRELEPSLVRQWSAQVPAVVATARELGEMEAAGLAAHTLARLRAARQTPEAPPPSLGSLLRRLRQPEVRRGLALALELVAALGSASPARRADPETQSTRTDEGDPHAYRDIGRHAS